MGFGLVPDDHRKLQRGGRDQAQIEQGATYRGVATPIARARRSWRDALYECVDAAKNLCSR